MARSTKMTACALILSAVCGSPAIAEGFYFGAGLGYTSAESNADIGVGYSEVDTGVLGLTGGYRWNMTNNFAAVELDADISFGADLGQNATGLGCSSGTSAPYFCTHDATVRLRGVFGTPIGNGWNLFGTLGYGFAMGDSAVTVPGATDSATVGGLTAGIGAEKQMGPGILRIEFIHDHFSNTLEKPTDGSSTFDPTWEANSLKATYLISF